MNRILSAITTSFFDESSKLKNYTEAEELLRQTLDGRRRKLGNDHPTCFESMHE